MKVESGTTPFYWLQPQWQTIRELSIRETQARFTGLNRT